jgi:glycosyltransferase involved in cell wall biosynthesis
MIDILFLAHNRIEFTKASLETLCKNTDWSEVRRLIVSDDNSIDGTREYLKEFSYPCDTELVVGKFGGPVAVMNRYLCEREGENDGRIFAKIDNDVMVPPGWLNECLRTMSKHPELGLLGIEAFTPLGTPPAGDARDYEPARHIGGIGLMRAGCFVTLPRANGRLGFTAWQERSRRDQGMDQAGAAGLPSRSTAARALDDMVRRIYPPRLAARLGSISRSSQGALELVLRMKIVGMLRVKNEARWIERVLRSMFPVCEQVYVFDDSSTDDTPLICAKFPNVSLFASPFEGVQEVRDKNWLLEQVETSGADWVLHIDGDEEIHPADHELLRDIAARGPADAYRFQILYLWERRGSDSRRRYLWALYAAIVLQAAPGRAFPFLRRRRLSLRQRSRTAKRFRMLRTPLALRLHRRAAAHQEMEFL